MNFSFCLMLCVWMLELSWNILLKYTGNKPWVTEYIKLLIRSLLWFSTLELLWPLYFWLVFSSSIYLLSSSLYFLAYSQPSQTGCPPYFHTWCGLSANVECISEMCCTQLAENTGRKKLTKIRHLRIIAQLCRTISSQLRHVLTIGKKAC